MRARFRSWWQTIRKPLLIFGSLVAIMLVIALIVAIIGGYVFNWGWAGLSRKTLWDWLQLLFIPVVLAVAGFWFNHRERKAAELRAEAESDIAEDNQREAALQQCIDKMSELLLEKHLRESQPEDEVRKIVRVRTLTVLRRIDKIRKRSLLQFLYEANLIDKDNAIVDASGANLDFVQLFKPKEDEDFPRLYGDNLRGANLHKADLFKADLRRADLRRANLSEADLRGVSLCDYILMEANLQGADLSDAELSGSDLSGADLSDAIVTGEQLAKARSLKGATMPDGSKHE